MDALKTWIAFGAASIFTVMVVACGEDSSSNSSESYSSAEMSSSSNELLNSSETVNSSETANSSESLNSSETLNLSESVESSSSEQNEVASSESFADTVWNKANLTWYTSWPDPGSEECIEYNGCTWAGYFAGVDGQQTEEWVSEHNIIAVHEKDWDKYKLKTFRLRQKGRTIDAVVYDMCSDEDCDGCCTENAGELGFLIDIESYSCKRLSANDDCDGVVEWTCLDCTEP